MQTLRGFDRRWMGVLAAFIAASVSAVAGHGDDPPILARSRIIITGGGIAISPATQVVPRNTATIVETMFGVPGEEGVDESDVLRTAFPSDAILVAELAGPSLATAVTLTTRPGEPFKIQPLAIAGLHYLRGIRLVSGGTTLVAANPDTVTLEVIDRVLVSQVTSRALTADEIRDRGIVIDQTNYQVVSFSAAFGFQDRKVNIDFPMILPTRNDVALAPAAPPLELPRLQPSAAPIPGIDLPRLIEAFQTANVSVGGMLLKVEDEDIERAFSVPALSGVIVIPGNIAYLNQFFSVLTLVSNAAPGYSNLTAHDVKAEISLPAGADGVAGSGDDPLRMARLGTPPVEQARSLPVTQAGVDGKLGTADDIVVIAPQQSGNSEHLVEGLREGVHTIEIKVSAMLYGLPIGPVPISGRVLGTVEVRNPTFALTLSHPATVTAGEEYDLKVTLTNTSHSPANFAAVSLLPQSISGATLLSNQTVQVESIAAGDSETVSFHLLSHTTGNITATSFSSEGIPGKFELTTAVGANGIALSPNTLVMPTTVNALPASLRDAGTAFLGQAFALATSPVTPEGLLPLSQSIVYDRATSLAQAGQRASLHEPLSAIARDLALDWSGNDFAGLASRFDIGQEAARQQAEQDFRGFDTLLRQSRRGRLMIDALGQILGPDVALSGAASFLDTWAAGTVSRLPHVAALAVPRSAETALALEVIDPAARHLGLTSPNGVIQNDVPFGSFVPLDSGGTAVGQMAVIATPQNGAHEVIVRTPGAGTFDFGIVVPESASLRVINYSGVQMNAGARARVRFVVGGTNTYVLEIDDDGNGVFDRTLSPSSTTLTADEGPRLVSAVQIVTGKDDPSRYGQIIALTFSEEVTVASAQSGLDPAQLTHYEVENNQVLGVSLQPGGRVVLLSLRDGLGPFVPRHVTVHDISDRLGHVMNPSPTTTLIEAATGLEGGTISGRVLSGRGTPVPQARIRLSHTFGDGTPPLTVSVKDADADGHYSFDFVRTFATTIDAIDPERGERGEVHATVRYPGQHLDLDVILLGSGTLAGRALSPLGQPLRDAVVRVTSLTRFGEVLSAVSNDSGAFSIAGVPVGNITIEAAHTGTNSRTLRASAIPTAGAVVVEDLTLIPLIQAAVQTGTVVGQVFRVDGVTPAVGIPVFTNRGGIATTDAAGAFRIELLPTGALTVRALDQARLEEATVATTIVPETVVTANLRLFGGTATVKGVVLDAGGVPVAGAQVGGGQTLQTTSATGEFTLSDMPLGQQNISAFDPATKSVGAAVASLTVPNETVTIQIILDARGTIAGRIFDAGGVPVSGLKVFLLGGQNLSAITDDAGGYRFENVAVGTYVVSAFTSDFSDGNILTTRLSFRGEVRVANVTFRGKGRVTGTVLAANGVTPLGARVGLSELRVKVGTLRPPENPFCLGNIQVADVTVELAQCQEVGLAFISEPLTRVVDNDVASGRFTFEDVFVGPVTVQAANALTPTVIGARGEIPTAGATLDLQLKLTATSTVEGTVFLPGGEPAGPDVVVTLNGRNVVTDQNGHFVHFEVVPGFFAITASDALRSGFVGQSYGAVAPGVAAVIPIKLLGKGSVAVEVHGVGGIVANARVHLRTGSFPGEDRDGFTGPDGRIVFSGGDAVFEGPFSVSAADSGVSGFNSGTVVRDQQVDLTIQLPNESGTVEGRFLNPAGTQPVPNAQIRLNSPGGEAFATTPADGTFHFEGVRLGQVTIEGFDPVTARRGRSTGALVAQGQFLTIDVTEIPLGTVGGFVRLSTDQSAVAAADVTISVDSIFGGQLRTTTNADGSFAFPGVSAGNFSMSATATGLSGHASGHLTNEGETVEADVILDVPARGRVEGFVTTASGAVALGAQVSLGSSHTTVDNNGFYFFTDVPIGPFNVQAAAPIGPDGGSATGSLAYAGEVAATNIRFIGTGAVNGLVSSGGVPVAFTVVTLTSRNNSGRSFSTTTQTNTDGAFAFPVVPVGDVSVTAVQTATQLAGTASGIISANGELLSLSVPLQSSAAIHGRAIRESSGAPASALAIEIDGASRRFGSTSADGTLRFTDLALGSYQITLTDPLGDAIAQSTFTLDHGAADLDLGDLVLDEFAPSVVSIDPASGAARVPVLQPIRVQFSEPINPVTVSTATIPVSGSTGPIAGVWTLSADRSIATFTAAGAFADFSQINVKVTTAVEDRVGRKLRDAVVAAFQTADSVPPSMTTVTPAVNQTGVQPSQVIRIAYSEALNAATLIGAAIDLRLGAATVPGRIDLLLNSTVIVFTPLSPLLPNSTYTVAVRPVADVFGNSQGQGLTYSFRTIDTLPPVIQRVAADRLTAFEGSAVAITAEMADPSDVASVEFLVNDVVVTTDSSAPYQALIPVTASLRPAFTVVARATDAAGNISTAASITISVQTDEAPTVAIITPSDGAAVNTGSQLVLHVRGTDDRGISRIAYQVSGQVANSATFAATQPLTIQDATFNISIPAGTAPGPLLIRVVATDTAGAISATASVSGHVVDGTPPVVVLSSPPADQRLASGASATFEVDASDDVAVGSISLTTTGAVTSSTTRPVSPTAPNAHATFTIAIPDTATSADLLAITLSSRDTSNNDSPPVHVTFAIRGAVGILRGVVSSSSGPLGGISVSAAGPDASQTTTAQDGSFSFELSPGHYTLTASRPNTQGTTVTASTQADVTAGGITSADITFPRAASIAGSVTRPDGTAASGVSVQLSATGFIRTTAADVSGHFSLIDVPDGNYTLAATDTPTRSAASVAVTMAGSDVTRNLTLAPLFFALSVDRSGSGSGLVSSSPPGINCGPDCAEDVDTGRTIALSAIPSIGSVFAGWSGDCTGMAACSVVADRARHVVAQFDRASAAVCTAPAPGRVAFWPADGDPSDIVAGRGGQLIGDARFVGGRVLQAFGFNGNGAVTVPDAPVFDPERQLTIDAWINPGPAAVAYPVVVGKENTSFAGLDDIQYQIAVGPSGTIWLFVGGLSGKTGGLPTNGDNWTDGGGPVPLNEWSHIALTVDLEAGLVRTYLNGSLLREYVVSPSLSITRRQGDLRIGNRTLFPGGFSGAIDEVGFYSRALSTDEVQAIFAAGDRGQCKGTVFDPAGDSTPANPNGVWTYGATTSAGTLTPYSVADTAGALTRWHVATGFGDSLGAPNVLQNRTGALYHDAVGDWPVNQIGLTPSNTEFSVVRFAAPASTEYTIHVLFKGADAATTDVHVARGSALLFSSSIAGRGDQTAFDTTLALARGETIDFLVGAGGNGSANDTTFVAATISTANPALSVSIAGTGTGTVTSSPAAITCEPDCAALFAPDTTVSLTAVPGPGSNFVEFAGACTESNPACTLTMNEPRRVTAIFRATGAGVDGDGDGLSDSEEAQRGTNPARADSDGDGVSDAVEIATGSDPLNPNSVPSIKRWTAADGAAPTNWFSAANWSPVGAPGVSDNVVIPRGAAAYPILTGAASVGNLVVEVDASIQAGAFRLLAGGSVFVFGTITGTDALEINGGAALARGNLPTLVVSGNVTFAGATTITGSATVFGRFDIAGQAVHITRTLVVPCGPCTGQLRMADPGGLLTIDQDVIIDGLDTSAALTTGDLHVGGNFFVGGSAPGNFAASGTHTTYFDGTSAQTITFCCGVGPTSRHFGRLVIANPAGVSLITDAYALSDLIVAANAVLSGSGTVTARNVSALAGSSVTPGGVALSGTLQSTGIFSPVTTTFLGTDQLIPAGLGYRNVTVTGTATMAGGATMQGSVLLTGQFDLGGQQVHVTGTLLIPCAPCTGRLRMKSPAGVMTIDQDAVVDGLDTSADLTAGQLHIGRNLFVGGSAAGNFAAAPEHTTYFDGSGPQTITFCCGVGATSRHFGSVVVANGSGVSLNTDAYALGDLQVSSGAVFNGTGTITARNVITGTNSTVTTGGVAIAGVLQAAGVFSPVTTTFQGAGQFVPGGLAYRNITVTGSAKMAGSATMQGTLLLLGEFDIAGRQLHVAGNLTIPCAPCTGLLYMTDPAGVLIVDQDAVFDGRDTGPTLTAGQLHVGRNFFVGGSTSTNFTASAQHVTYFDGTVAQTVTFCCGVGATTRHFGHVVFANSAGTSLITDAYAAGDASVRSGGSLIGSGTLTVGGNVTTEAGTNVAPAGMALGQVLSASGTFSPGTTTFTGQGQLVPGGLGYRNVTVSGTARMAGAATMQGTLLLTGEFDLAGQQVHVTGALLIPCAPCSGRLTMTDADGKLFIDQDASFDGLNTNGALTRGEIHIGRNMFVGGSDAQNFAASEQHVVIFDGTAQSILFCCGVGPTSRHFANLSLNGGTTVSLSSEVVVNGALLTRTVSGLKPALVGGGHTLAAEGSDIDGGVFDNVALVLGSANGLKMSGAVFRNYPASATPLTINASVLSATFTGLEFQSVPGTQGAYIRGNDVDGPSTLAELTITASRPLYGLPKAISTNGFVFHWGSTTDDTDGDGLTDADELQNRHTDPLQADTDGDGVSDGDEVAIGSNPLLSETCAVPPGGLLSWWPADNDANDIAGSRPGVAVNGVTFVAGRAGAAFHFDGVGFVEASAEGLPAGSAPRTVEFWMRPVFNARAPFMYGAPAASDGFYPIVMNNVACIGEWGGGLLEVCGTTTVTDGLWHHLAMTYNGANAVVLYVDGHMDASVAKSYNTTAGGTVRLGAPFASASDFFHGDLDDIAVYDRALRLDEIQRLVLAGRAGKCMALVGDARQEYSIAANPNGSWTYGASPTLGQIVPFTRVEGQAWLGAPGIAEQFGAPAVFLSGSGQLVFHPGPNGDFGVIRWQAPNAGVFDVDASFGAGSSTTTDVHVVVNGQSVFDGTINGATDQTHFHGTVTLQRGDTVDFAVGTGGNGFFSDSTLIDAQIRKSSGQ